MAGIKATAKTRFYYKAGKHVEPGEELTLTEQEAARYLKLDYVELDAAAEKKLAKAAEKDATEK